MDQGIVNIDQIGKFDEMRRKSNRVVVVPEEEFEI